MTTSQYGVCASKRLIKVFHKHSSVRRMDAWNQLFFSLHNWSFFWEAPLTLHTVEQCSTPNLSSCPMNTNAACYFSIDRVARFPFFSCLLHFARIPSSLLRPVKKNIQRISRVYLERILDLCRKSNWMSGWYRTALFGFSESWNHRMCHSVAKILQTQRFFENSQQRS